MRHPKGQVHLLLLSRRQLDAGRLPDTFDLGLNLEGAHPIRGIFCLYRNEGGMKIGGLDSYSPVGYPYVSRFYQPDITVDARP